MTARRGWYLLGAGTVLVLAVSSWAWPSLVSGLAIGFLVGWVAVVLLVVAWAGWRALIDVRRQGAARRAELPAARPPLEDSPEWAQRWGTDT